MHDFCDRKDDYNKDGIKKEYELLLRQYAREQNELWEICKKQSEQQMMVRNSSRAIKEFVDKYSKELDL